MSTECAASSPPAPRRRVPAWLPRMVAIGCWLAILFAYLLRLLAAYGPGDLVRDDQPYLYLWYTAFLARTFSFHIGCGALVAGLVALLVKRRAAALLALPLVLMSAQGLLFHAHVPEPLKDRPHDLRLLSVNLLWVNKHPAPHIADIKRIDADVIAIQEYTSLWDRAMRAALSNSYPYIVADPRDGQAFGEAIYSKYPLRDVTSDAAFGLGRYPAQRAIIEHPRGDVLLYNVHLVPPMRVNLRTLRRQFQWLTAELAEATLPVIVAGDLNFTTETRFHDRLSDLGLLDAHEEAGRGRASTWPMQGLFRIYPGVGIDHVYVSPSITVQSCEYLPAHASDHRPLYVDLIWD